MALDATEVHGRHSRHMPEPKFKISILADDTHRPKLWDFFFFDLEIFQCSTQGTEIKNTTGVIQACCDKPRVLQDAQAPHVKKMCSQLGDESRT